MLYLGDCLEIMKELPDNSVDSVVTDPPYELGFMNKGWDKNGIAFNGQVWTECLRILKPGGYLLSFGGTRTYHRMACAVEDAGFEIRDCIFWVYGSGFPKSLNIGKAVDKLLGNEREVLREEKEPLRQGGTVNWDMRSSQDRKLTRGTSEWEGWGTSLKPAVEPIVLARKPLSEKTVAENVLKCGTGGLNIDGCRIDFADNEPDKRVGTDSIAKGASKNPFKTGISDYENPMYKRGRFPANLIHDGSEEVVGMFPVTETHGSRTGGDYKPRQPIINFGGGRIEPYPHSEGSAARFFYCPKASKAERNMGLEGFEQKTPSECCEGRKPGSAGLNSPRAGAGRTSGGQNNHPTVKPISLMRYLCRLITPPNGIILDPFMGSGSTGIAAKTEGFDFIGIEKDEGYFKIAERRINNALLL